ncbi:MAG: Gfo/Idh/MocA family oxidoreductase [Phycisphaerales bacterium]|jgi:predicted dehydrogenase/threonine dehydrogenase-like Zn-dependent dehydrogenase|nr:Gfo/Idh/MocA family oxidoreductase [Phycisphaerales bacterium]MBT7170390.1 Gfo/Idh/MocA family oxidoreductase [Phycisphaerales bacterium]
MKQILQNLRSGETRVAELPAPACGRGMVKIQTRNSLISAGTERMLVEFSKGGLIAKAKAQPDKVKQVLDKIKTDGLLPTLDSVFKRLGEPLPLGYCNVGTVLEVGPGVSDYQIGDRVVSNGSHAEVVVVPKNLCAKIPDGVSDEDATFTVLTAIGLQGIRLAAPTLGERFVVFGAGLIGLVTIQLLRANGCEVLAIDLNEDRLAMARSYGAQTCNAASGDPIAAASSWTDGAGVDGVLVTASAKTDELMHQAAEMCRKRARIILVGVVGLNLRRSDFFEKEITFQVSCSYGPGRYDDNYEQKGQDYPLGFVRWTEQRNFQAVLGAMASGQLVVNDLITDRIALDDAAEAYNKISNDPSAMGVILGYDAEVQTAQTIEINQPATQAADQCVAVVLGAGNFAKMTMSPALAKTNARLKYISDLNNSPAATHIAEKYGFENATSDTDAALADPDVNTVFIATGHASHAALTCKGLEAGKHVFVEKPLAMNVEQLQQVLNAAKAAPAQQLMVGFNRRYSPHIQQMRTLLAGRSEPLAMHYACNAGIIPPEVWVHDPELGGGRIIGEACHFIDLLSYLAGSKIVSVASAQMGQGVAVREDKMSIVLSFEDGSVGTVNYFGNGNKAYSKETIDVYSEGRILHLDNFRKLTGHGFSGFKKLKTKINKGHQTEFKLFTEAVAAGGEPMIPLAELTNATLASFAAMTSAAEGRTIRLDTEYTLS